jgi:hypothetical protein
MPPNIDAAISWISKVLPGIKNCANSYRTIDIVAFIDSWRGEAIAFLYSIIENKKLNRITARKLGIDSARIWGLMECL